MVSRTVRRVPAPEDFTSPLRRPAVSARVGAWLGGCFAIAFVTGLISHYAQLPDPVLPVPPAPAWGYRVSQGLHVASGSAAIPLVLVKLYAVYPRLFARPPRARGELLRHALERVSIAVLVGAATFQLGSGLANAAGWYPWAFRFVPTHYAMAWIAVGALAVHVAVKLPAARAAVAEADPRDRGEALSRAGLLRVALTTAGLAAVATAAGVPGLRRVALFAPRSGDGPQGVPVNRTAAAAGITAAAIAGYRLEIAYAERRVRLSLADLLALPSRQARLPIACVEGWSASGTWQGVPVRALLDLVAAPRDSTVRVSSMQRFGGYRESTLPGPYADHPDTLLATHLAGEPLSLDHGAPARLIAPNRPGVLQTKWVSRLEVLP